jgi:hypothetical protein
VRQFAAREAFPVKARQRAQQSFRCGVHILDGQSKFETVAWDTTSFVGSKPAGESGQERTA